MRVVLTGASGLIGQEIWNIFHKENELYAVGRHRPKMVPISQWKSLDITNPEECMKLIPQINPDCLIHSAALSNPDDCEENPDLAYLTNALGTRNLALACQRFDTEMLYLSTDQVFDGKDGKAYREIDTPHPTNHYGHSKLWGEQFVQTLLRRFYIVRTALVFGPGRPTFIDRVSESAFTRATVTGALDIVNSPTYSPDLAKSILELIHHHTYGVYHIVNEGFCNRYELATYIAQTLHRNDDFIVKGFKKDLSLKANRPGSTPLQNFVWNLNGFPKMRTWQEAIGFYLTQKGVEG